MLLLTVTTLIVLFIIFIYLFISDAKTSIYAHKGNYYVNHLPVINPNNYMSEFEAFNNVILQIINNMVQSPL